MVRNPLRTNLSDLILRLADTPENANTPLDHLDLNELTDGRYQDPRNTSSTTNDSHSHGTPGAKARLAKTDGCALVASIIFLAIAIVTVSIYQVAWAIGYNWQLVIIGVMMSATNLCLETVTTTVFLQLEVSCGSRLNNLEAILQSAPFTPGSQTHWRIALLYMAILGPAVGVLYKQFPGGTTTITIASSNLAANISLLGLYPLPGLLPLGFSSGLSLMFNNTIPFQMASYWLSDADLTAHPEATY